MFFATFFISNALVSFDYLKLILYRYIETLERERKRERERERNHELK